MIFTLPLSAQLVVAEERDRESLPITCVLKELLMVLDKSQASGSDQSAPKGQTGSMEIGMSVKGTSKTYEGTQVIYLHLIMRLVPDSLVSNR